MNYVLYVKLENQGRSFRFASLKSNANIIVTWIIVLGFTEAQIQKILSKIVVNLGL